MSWQSQLNGESVAWLLEAGEPGVRYLALRDLLDRPSSDPELLTAQAAAHAEGPIATIIGAMDGAGYWARPGPGYNPKYRSTVWSLIMLAQLGASTAMDSRLQRACTYLIDHALTPSGQFSVSGVPSGTIDCLQGNLCWALVELGCEDPRLEPAFEWMARSVTGEGVSGAADRQAPLRYQTYKCGPLFSCAVNGRQPCGWGAVKVMLAFSKWRATQRTPLIDRAIQQGVAFLLGTDPAAADYPTRKHDKPSRNWWKFGFPVFYVTDLLQNVEALVGLGYGKDPRLANALATISKKQDAQGRWMLEYDYAGKTWVDFGTKKQPNKWVTLRAVRVLKAAASSGAQKPER
jgi:hypothetical protein